jgi:hypothetical protein
MKLLRQVLKCQLHVRNVVGTGDIENSKGSD